MWHREYRDYKTDQKNIKNPVEPGRGICGCEMHEVHGWGNTLHHPKRNSRLSYIDRILSWLKWKQLK